jgi:hypothetical protein
LKVNPVSEFIDFIFCGFLLSIGGRGASLLFFFNFKVEVIQILHIILPTLSHGSLNLVNLEIVNEFPLFMNILRCVIKEIVEDDILELKALALVHSEAEGVLQDRGYPFF